MYQPGAIVVCGGADSLSGDRLGCFNLSLQVSLAACQSPATRWQCSRPATLGALAPSSLLFVQGHMHGLSAGSCPPDLFLLPHTL